MILIQSVDDFDSGISKVLNFEKIKVARNLKKEFHDALNKAVFEKDIPYFEVITTPFKKHFRYRRFF